MGEYNFYVWTSVFISFLALFLAYYDALKKQLNDAMEHAHRMFQTKLIDTRKLIED